MMPKRWYAAKLRSNREQQTRSALLQKGIPSFLPVYAVASTRSDREIILEKPLFPGYIFVQLEIPGPTKTAVLSCPGVVGLVQFNNSPAEISDEVMDSLMIVANQSEQLQPHPLVQSGRPVKVVSGNFAGATGVMQQATSGGAQLVVEIVLLGRAVAVPILSHQVTPVI